MPRLTLAHRRGSGSSRYPGVTFAPLFVIGWLTSCRSSLGQSRRASPHPSANVYERETRTGKCCFGCLGRIPWSINSFGHVAGRAIRSGSFHPHRERQQPLPRSPTNPERLATGRLELPGHDASGNTCVENEPSSCRSGNALDQDVGIARPGPVITLGIRPERFRHLALVTYPKAIVRPGTCGLSKCGSLRHQRPGVASSAPSIPRLAIAAPAFARWSCWQICQPRTVSLGRRARCSYRVVRLCDPGLRARSSGVGSVFRDAGKPPPGVLPRSVMCEGKGSAVGAARQLPEASDRDQQAGVFDDRGRAGVRP